MKSLFIAVFLFSLSFAEIITIGEPELLSGDPFCGDCALSLHFQVLYLEEEIGQPITIEELGWKRTPGGAGSASFTNFAIYMGYCETDELGETYLENYVPGTRTLVLDRPTYTISGDVDEWITETLDVPFWYDGSDNLIIEYEWGTGTGSVYIYAWDTGTFRALTGGYGSSTGSLLTVAHYQQLIGQLGLDPSTLAGMKTAFSKEL
ncbi:hypothetical protein JW921_10785 [Candidatus Fermentibacterales bacterium]|nr:hypothetical protein [Candidatus Fermentibacterales bacterium]